MNKKKEKLEGASTRGQIQAKKGKAEGRRTPGNVYKQESQKL